MGSLFHLNKEEAVAAETRQDAIADLKPVGAYRVTVEKVYFFSVEGKTPYFSYLVRIVGLLEKDGTFATKKDGSKVYTNAPLFLKAFVSDKALFTLVDLHHVMGREMTTAKLVDSLSSLTSEKKALAWAMSFIDKGKEFNVWVTHDLTGKVPQEKVSISTVQPR